MWKRIILIDSLLPTTECCFLDAVKRNLGQLQYSTVLRACKRHPGNVKYRLFVNSGDEGDSSYKLLENSTNGRPRHRLGDNIKTDLTETGRNDGSRTVLFPQH